MATPSQDLISWADFRKVDMRIGTIIRAEPFPEARNPSYKIWINFGAAIGVRKSSAQITSRYQPEDLVGKQVVAVVNFPSKQVANMQSECLVLGAVEDKDIVLLSPDQPVPNGLRIG